MAGSGFVSPKEEEGRKDDMVFEGRLSGRSLVGETQRTGRNGVDAGAANARPR